MIGKILTLKKRVGTIEKFEVIGWKKCKGLMNDYIIIYYKKLKQFQPIYESLHVNSNFDLNGWYVEDNKVSYEFINKLIENKGDRHMPNDIYVIFSQSNIFLDKQGKKLHMDSLYINQLDDIDKQNKAIENIIFETREEAMKVYASAYIDLTYDILKIDIGSIIELIVNYKAYRKNINKLYSLNPQVVK